MSRLDRIPLYLRKPIFDYAVNEAKNEVEEQIVSNLIQANRFTTAEIANFASVTEEFVEKVRADLGKKR